MPPKGISKAKPFRPARPSAASKSTVSAASSRRVSAKATKVKPNGKGKEAAQDTSDIADDDPFASSLPQVEAEADFEPEPEIEEQDLPEITIQPELLTKILHEFFTKDSGMRISKDASKAIGKYMHTFVLEALHRAVAENRATALHGRTTGSKDTFIEVEDLEKLAPQMLLDF